MGKSKKIMFSGVTKEHAELRRNNKIEIICLYTWVGALFLSLLSCLTYIVIFGI